VHALITRALRNAGDDLIHQRARRMLDHLVPELELVAVRGWERLDANLSSADLARLESVIVPGGPGVRRNLAQVHPFLEEARQRRIPVRFLGVGSRFFPGSMAAHRTLIDPGSAQELRHLAGHAAIGVRDHLTQQLLQRVGVAAQVNGCPAWYSIEHLGTRPALPTRIGRVALTTPGALRFTHQFVALMHTVAGVLPSARVLVGFHHGLEGGEPAAAGPNAEFARVAKALRFDVVDLASDSSKLIQAYADCDLHVGYRVHAHILFSSLRKPTFLLAEDSRGVGVLQTLGGEGLVAWNELAEHTIVRSVLARARPELMLTSDGDVAQWLEGALARALDQGFPHVETAARIIDHTFQTRMAPFVRAIAAPSASSAA